VGLDLVGVRCDRTGRRDRPGRSHARCMVIELGRLIDAVGTRIRRRPVRSVERLVDLRSRSISVAARLPAKEAM